MPIELTTEQTQALAAEGEGIVVIDPRTRQAYRLVKEDVFKRVQALAYDDSPWTPAETGLLAGEAFAKLDDTDYSGYLGDDP
ncbi:MAG TPA: hypothetical protein VM529_23195 [Gemmata sp.]|nr:hypothetical protein [Gemmata sp.]